PLLLFADVLPVSTCVKRQPPAKLFSRMILGSGRILFHAATRVLTWALTRLSPLVSAARRRPSLTRLAVAGLAVTLAGGGAPVRQVILVHIHPYSRTLRLEAVPDRPIAASVASSVEIS